MPASRTKRENSAGSAGCAAVSVVIKDGSCISDAAKSSVAVDGECVTLICSREWRMFINVGGGR